MKYVLFDIDGTLVDHSGAEERAMLSIFKQYFSERLESDFAAFASTWRSISETLMEQYLKGLLGFEEQRTMRIMEVFSTFGRKLEVGPAKSIAAQYLQAYESSWQAYDDVSPCLAGLRQYYTGVLSNGQGDQQRKKLKRTGLLASFQHFFFAGDLGVAKPDPDIFKRALLTLDCSPKEAVYVGDNLKIDIEPACGLGIYGVYIDRTAPKIHRQNHMASIPSLTHLAEVISRIEQNDGSPE